jgi:FkbM family methyltransferase
VGGYSGYYTLLATTTNPSLKAVCFEPVSTLRAWIGHHLDTNALRHRVTLEPTAISDKTGTARFHGTDVAFSPGGSLSHSFKSHARPIADVATTRLDDYCKTYERWPDLLKIDAEGFELEILRGATEVLNASRPTIVCEVLESDPTRRRDLQDVLEAARYRWARITPAGLIETSVLEPDLNSRRDRNYLFWPSERRAPGA